MGIRLVGEGATKVNTMQELYAEIGAFEKKFGHTDQTRFPIDFPSCGIGDIEASADGVLTQDAISGVQQRLLVLFQNGLRTLRTRNGKELRFRSDLYPTPDANADFFNSEDERHAVESQTRLFGGNPKDFQQVIDDRDVGAIALMGDEINHMHAHNNPRDVISLYSMFTRQEADRALTQIPWLERKAILKKRKNSVLAAHYRASNSSLRETLKGKLAAETSLVNLIVGLVDFMGSRGRELKLSNYDIPYQLYRVLRVINKLQQPELQAKVSEIERALRDLRIALSAAADKAVYIQAVTEFVDKVKPAANQ